ncbi:hypothetical protein BDV35DRAFT_283198 [Aspergillus flavus]|uniref:Uncharacterized protein n=1 Tax=Aspergillus flavus TaxID=5059 RepID=A0A5N6GUL6_ASPFL|nr:hypothetical protein BDV35DRAFT_283198 [Aspergillus flavus]
MWRVSIKRQGQECCLACRHKFCTRLQACLIPCSPMSITRVYQTQRSGTGWGRKSKGRPKIPGRYLTSAVEASHLAGADLCFHAKEVKRLFDGVWRIHRRTKSTSSSVLTSGADA